MIPLSNHAIIGTSELVVDNTHVATHAGILHVLTICRTPVSMLLAIGIDTVSHVNSSSSHVST